NGAATQPPLNPRSRLTRGTALIEFALAWPIALLLALGSVETAVWGSEAYAARSAALAGARAAAATGGTPVLAVEVTRRILSPSLVGVSSSAWCPGGTQAAPALWVCATDLGDAVQVEVGGMVPAIVPLVGADGLPLHARVVVQKEVFSR
ncbi:MAG TPA: TadE/TadG family type IV pilus assembly protein, partial [Candidatus Dormibacteraeota bacterium]